MAMMPDQKRGGLCRQPLHSALGRMDALEQVVERERPVVRNHDLAIDGELVGFHVEDGFDQFGKIARQRAARLRSQIDPFAIAKHQTAKPVPFRLVLPAASGRDLVDRKRLHGCEWRPQDSPLHLARLAISDRRPMVSGGRQGPSSKLGSGWERRAATTAGNGPWDDLHRVISVN